MTSTLGPTPYAPYMRNILFVVGIAIVAGIAAAGATSASWIFWEVLRGEERDAFRAVLGAFCGALFAFIFVRLGEGLKRIYDRKERNHDAMVRLQHYLNDCLNTTSDNIFIADTFLAVFEEQKLESGQRPIFINRFHEYTIDRELIVGLSNLDLINELYSINTELRKLSSSLATIDRAYEQIMEAFVSKKIDPDVYLANVRHSRARYVEVREFLVQTKSDLVRMFATINLLAKAPPFLVRLIRAMTRTRYTKKFKRMLPAEVARVSQEIEAGAKASAKRIEEIQDRVAQQSVQPDRPPA